MQYFMAEISGNLYQADNIIDALDQAVQKEEYPYLKRVWKENEIGPAVYGYRSVSSAIEAASLDEDYGKQRLYELQWTVDPPNYVRRYCMALFPAEAVRYVPPFAVHARVVSLNTADEMLEAEKSPDPGGWTKMAAKLWLKKNRKEVL